MKEDTSSCRSSVPSQFSLAALARRTLVAAAPGAGVGCTTWRRQESRRGRETAKAIEPRSERLDNNRFSRSFFFINE
jgi:hypothetical protein